MLNLKAVKARRDGREWVQFECLMDDEWEYVTDFALGQDKQTLIDLVEKRGNDWVRAMAWCQYTNEDQCHYKVAEIYWNELRTPTGQKDYFSHRMEISPSLTDTSTTESETSQHPLTFTPLPSNCTHDSEGAVGEQRKAATSFAHKGVVCFMNLKPFYYLLYSPDFKVELRIEGEREGVGLGKWLRFNV